MPNPQNEETFRQRRPTQNQPPQQFYEEPPEGPVTDGPDNAFNRQVPAFSEGPDSGFKMSGQMPEGLRQAIRADKMENGEDPMPKAGFGNMRGKEDAPVAPQRNYVPQQSGAATGRLKEILDGLQQRAVYDEIQLPSLGKFYDNNSPFRSGYVGIRPMTGEEEQILATPHLVRKGQAINMIFQRCIREAKNTRDIEELLTIDRTYILIYLRGISYTPSYDAEVRCPSCEKKFETTIRLDGLMVEPCPDHFGPVLEDVLPTTKLPFTYRLQTGRDEQELSEYRDKQLKAFGNNAQDNTLTYRTAQLLDHIDGIRHKTELMALLKHLPIADVSYIRNCLNDPPFGVDTDIEVLCPSCLEDFNVDLPLEANFFFPRRKKDLK